MAKFVPQLSMAIVVLLLLVIVHMKEAFPGISDLDLPFDFPLDINFDEFLASDL